MGFVVQVFATDSKQSFLAVLDRIQASKRGQRGRKQFLHVSPLELIIYSLEL
jgi:hypothetical protein